MWVKANDRRRNHKSFRDQNLIEKRRMENEEKKKRIIVTPADEGLTYEQQQARIERIASAALVKLELLLREATTPDEVKNIVSALLDAQKLAKAATPDEPAPSGGLSDFGLTK